MMDRQLGQGANHSLGDLPPGQADAARSQQGEGDLVQSNPYNQGTLWVRGAVTGRARRSPPARADPTLPRPSWRPHPYYRPPKGSQQKRVTHSERFENCTPSAPGQTGDGVPGIAQARMPGEGAVLAIRRRVGSGDPRARVSRFAPLAQKLLQCPDQVPGIERLGEEVRAQTTVMPGRLPPIQGGHDHPDGKIAGFQPAKPF